MSELHDLDLELSVIAGAMLDREVCSTLAGELGLRSDHFAAPAHRAAWRLLSHRAVHGAGPLDPHTLPATLAEHPELHDTDGVSADDLLAVVGAAADRAATLPIRPGAEHASTLRDLAERRRLVALCQQAMIDAQQRDRSVRDVASRTADLLVGDASPASSGVTTAAASITRHLESWEHPERNRGISTGIPSLDRVMGLEPGRLTILAARPAVGKSLLSTQIATHVARHEGAHVLLASLEMSDRELAARVAAPEARVPGQWLTREAKGAGQHQDRWERLLAVTDDPAMHRLSWTDNADLSASDVVSLARRQHARNGGLGLVVVDYLQLLRPQDSRVPRVQQVAEMSRSLKVMALNLGVPVLALSQLSRAGESDSRPPKLSDLRDSGALEQDADQVLFLHRPKAQAPPGDGPPLPDTGDTQLIVAKNRSGASGLTVNLLLEPQYPRLIERAPLP